MLKLEGKCIGTVTYPAKAERPEFHQLQILVEQQTKSGDIRKDIVNLTVKNPSLYREGEDVSIPVSAFAAGDKVRFVTYDI